LGIRGIEVGVVSWISWGGERRDITASGVSVPMRPQDWDLAKYSNCKEGNEQHDRLHILDLGSAQV
jgi:hypothetical protein